MKSRQLDARAISVVDRKIHPNMPFPFGVFSGDALKSMEDRFFQHFNGKPTLSWRHADKEVEMVMATFDRGMGLITASPTEKCRSRYTELDILDLPLTQNFFGPPPGSFGFFMIDIVDAKGVPAILIEEIIASRGYRQLNPNESFHPWVNAGIDHILHMGDSIGASEYFASTKKRIRELNRNLPSRETHGALQTYYQLPFRDKWEKEEISFRGLPGNSYWRYNG